MQDKRFWLAGGVLAAVLILLVGWFGVINPQRSSTKTLRDEAASAQAQNSVLQTRIAKLKLENDRVGELTASLRQALMALPSDSGLPELTRQLSSQARRYKITLSSIAVGSMTPVAATGVAPTGTSAAGALFSIPVTLTSSGLGPRQISFLRAIQVAGPRRALVSSTQLSPAGGASIDGPTTLTTQITVFTAPLSADAQAQLKKLLNGDG